MYLTYCPQCKTIKENNGMPNHIMATVKLNVVGIKRETVYHGYCCERVGGPDNIGKVWLPLWIAAGETPHVSSESQTKRAAARQRARRYSR